LSERIVGGGVRRSSVARVDARAHSDSIKLDLSPEEPVRQPAEPLETDAAYQGRAKSPAHPSIRLIAQLNQHWRVIDDPLQWILQRKKGNPRAKNSGWQNRAFCRTREALLRCIRELCCLPDEDQPRCIHAYRGLDEAALGQVRALPERRVDSSSSSTHRHDEANLNACAANEAAK
jgi:hypothetical protein